MPARPLFERLANGALLLATLAEVLLPFVRNVVLARLLVPHEFGLAVTLSVVWGILEQVTDIGIHFSAIRPPGTVTPGRYYATLHSLAMLRGGVLLLVLTAISPLCAMAFNAPEATWAYAFLGVAAFIRSFSNLGIREAMRSYEYWREGLVVFASQMLWTGVTVIGCLWFQNYYAALVGIIGNAVFYVALSHLFSPRRWRFGWDKAAAKESLAFGRPLMFNGMSNAFTQLADRFVVGATLGVVQLGIYNVTMATAVLPRNAVTKFMNTLYMPGFVNLGEDKARAVLLFETWVLNLALIGFAYGIGLISIGAFLIETIFGPAFRPSELIMGLVSILLCTKFLIQLPVPPALAFGHTRLIFYGNLASAFGVLVSIAVLLTTFNFDLFVGSLMLGEIAALCFIAVRCIPTFGLVRWLLWVLVLLPSTVLAGLLAVKSLLVLDGWRWIAISWSVGVVTIIGLVALSLLAGWRPSVIKVLREAKVAGAGKSLQAE